LSGKRENISFRIVGAVALGMVMGLAREIAVIPGDRHRASDKPDCHKKAKQDSARAGGLAAPTLDVILPFNL
jgi:hypothetical protein